MNVTVKEILQLDILKDSRIAAGEGGLCRPVSVISVIEAPDIVDWIYGGEMLLTTLYSVMQAHLSVEVFFEQLCQKGISALLVKTGRSIDSLPPEMLRLADQYQIPLIELQFEVRYIDIISRGMQLLLNNQTEKLNHYLQVQNQLTALMTGGADVKDTLRFVSEEVDIALKLENEAHVIISRTHPEEEFSQRPLLQSFPIICARKTAGFLIAGSEEPLREDQRVILENACSLIAMEFLKKMYAQEIERNYLNDFLDDLFSKPWQPARFGEKLARYGCPQEGFYRVAEIHLKFSAPLSPEEKNAVNAAVLSALFPDRKHLVRVYDGVLRILLYSSQKEEKIPQKISEKLEIFKKTPQFRLPAPELTVGLSACLSGAEAIFDGAEEAKACIHYAAVLRRPLVCYESLGVLQLFNMYPNAQRLEKVIPQSVLRLAAYDEQNHSQYIKTLESYFEQNGNLSNASKTLFLHYKTMLHRMERIKQITGICLEDSNQRLETQLGIKLYQLLREGDLPTEKPDSQQSDSK